MATRAERFDDLVVEATARLERAWGRPVPEYDLGVEDVPPSDPAPWEHEEVPLGRLFAGQGREPARIVLYRRPIETRADGTRDLALLVDEVVTEHLAALLGVDPRELDPRFDTD